MSNNDRWFVDKKNMLYIAKDDEDVLIQKNVRSAVREADYIYTYAVEGRKDSFCRIDFNNLIPEYIADGSLSFGNRMFVKKFVVLNDKMAYIAENMVGECNLYVLDMSMRTTEKLDDRLPDTSVNTYELFLDDEWIYYGAYNMNGEYLLKNKIRYDGTDKLLVHDDKIFTQITFREKLYKEVREWMNSEALEKRGYSVNE